MDIAQPPDYAVGVCSIHHYHERRALFVYGRRGDTLDRCVVPLDQLLAALNLPPDTNPNVAIKDLISQGKLGEVTVLKDAAAKLQAK